MARVTRSPPRVAFPRSLQLGGGGLRNLHPAKRPLFHSKPVLRVSLTTGIIAVLPNWDS